MTYAVYWDKRYPEEGYVWGEQPSKTAACALKVFNENGIRRILVPGSGYGRNTRLFSMAGLDVTGIEISKTACQMAGCYDPLTKIHCGSVLDMPFDTTEYDAIYCFNVLHLFLRKRKKAVPE